MAYRSAQKLRRDNALSEITSDATLKAAALANLGLTDVAGNNVAVASGKTFAVSNTMTLAAGADGRTFTFPSTSATIARTDAANTFTGVQTMTSPAITTPALTGTATGTYSLGGTPTIVAPVVSTGLTASGSASNDFSASTGTFKTSSGANTLSGATTLAATKSLTLAAGTATATQAPLYLQSGTNLTAAEAGAIEYDGVNSYMTNETTSGRGLFGVHQYFGLQSSGSTISTIANFFGTTSNISLVSGGYYDIDIYCWFLNSTSGTVVWTFTNSAAPTAQNIYYESSPVTGVVAPPGTATSLVGQIVGDNTATKALSATSAITDAINMYTRFKIFLKNGTGTSLKIQATKSAGTITPLLGSYWTCRRLPATNVGSFAA